MRNDHTGMTLIVKNITRITVGLIFIYGIYIALQGHVSPGGGFAGGVIIALSFIHLMLAFGKEAVLRKLNEGRGVILTSAGALILLFTVMLGSASRRPFDAGAGSAGSANIWLLSCFDLAVALMVGAGLFVIFLAFVLLIGERGRS